MKGLRTLVLNNAFQPISVFPLYTTTAEDAIVRCLQGTAYSILDYDREIRTPSRHDLLWPSVIVNKNSFKYSDAVKLKKETLFYRDKGKCQYCSTTLTIPTLTYDHVDPRSRGGGHRWDNVVAACGPCNSRKGSQLPVGQWKPKRKPWTPTYWELLDSRRNYPIQVDDPRWIEFLGGEWPGGVIVRKANRMVCDGIDDDQGLEVHH